MSFTNYFEQKLLDFAFNGVAYTPPATWYVTFSTEVATDTSGLTGEMTGGSWGGRKAVSFDNWNATDGVANDGSINFITAAGTVRSVLLVDASSGGNVCSYHNLSSPRTYADGDSVAIAIGDLKQMLD